MIQELLGGSGIIATRDRKIPINGGILLAASPSLLPSSPSASPSPTSSAVTTTATTNTSTTTTSNSENQNLRCPRCDSSNTKFCYYNNYNLTQPRHFCKTCRRYWTKGGALRNVPIGGGCRKNRNASFSTSVSKTSAARIKTVASEIGRAGFSHDQLLPVTSSQVLWSTPQNSHILSFLRATQQAQNPNSNPRANVVSHIIADQPLVPNNVLNATTLGLECPLSSHVPSSFNGICSSIWKNNYQIQNQLPQQNGSILGEVQNNTEIQELYGRFRSATPNKYSTDQTPSVFPRNAYSSTTCSSSTLECDQVGGGESGLLWNSTFSWPDLQTTNAAYQ